MLCPASALATFLCSICMESTTCSKSVVGPLIRMCSPTLSGAVSSTIATLILLKKWVMCPIWATSSLSILFSSIVLLCVFA